MTELLARDESEMDLAVGVDTNGNIRIVLGSHLGGLVLSPDEAEVFAQLILKNVRRAKPQ